MEKYYREQPIEAELQSPLEALDELDAAVARMAARLNELDSLPTALASAWKSVLDARDELEAALRQH
jgi:hypothetical protein